MVLARLLYAIRQPNEELYFITRKHRLFPSIWIHYHMFFPRNNASLCICFYVSTNNEAETESQNKRPDGEAIASPLILININTVWRSETRKCKLKLFVVRRWAKNDNMIPGVYAFAHTHNTNDPNTNTSLSFYMLACSPFFVLCSECVCVCVVSFVSLFNFHIFCLISLSFYLFSLGFCHTLALFHFSRLWTSLVNDKA